jgi:hypothetical protein
VARSLRWVLRVRVAEVLVHPIMCPRPKLQPGVTSPRLALEPLNRSPALPRARLKAVLRVLIPALFRPAEAAHLLAV